MHGAYLTAPMAAAFLNHHYDTRTNQNTVANSHLVATAFSGVFTEVFHGWLEGPRALSCDISYFVRTIRFPTLFSLCHAISQSRSRNDSKPQEVCIVGRELDTVRRRGINGATEAQSDH